MLAIKTLPLKLIVFRRVVRLMGIQFEISVVGNHPNWAEERINQAIAEISRVEKLLSAFNDGSAVNLINRNAGVIPVKTNAEVFRLIERSLQVSELTHGAFDITYYAIDKEESGFENISTSTRLKRAISYRNLILDAKAQTVFLKDKGMRLGFGANGKGYAADRAKYILQMHGVSSGVINADGDLLAWGAQPDNEPWTIATADPDQKTQPFANVNISDMAIATSVNSEKNTSIINKSINAIDAKNGFPVSEIKSVSILSPSAELADAMATPVILIGVNAGLYLINQLNQMACIIIDDHDRIYTSNDVSIANR